MLLLYKKIVESMWEVAKTNCFVLWSPPVGDSQHPHPSNPKGAAPRRNSVLHPPGEEKEKKKDPPLHEPNPQGWGTPEHWDRTVTKQQREESKSPDATPASGAPAGRGERRKEGPTLAWTRPARMGHPLPKQVLACTDSKSSGIELSWRKRYESRSGARREQFLADQGCSSA